MSALFDDSVLIVAHPDDECLWFSSLLADIGSVVICYTDHPHLADVGASRRKALAQLPEKFVSLDLPEVDTFASIDWDHPQPTEFGLQLRHPHIEQRYQDNFRTLPAKLDKHLQGKKNVFTHNPWGEYGHADHVQLYCVLRQLQASYGYTLWHSNYVSNQTINRAMEYVDGFATDYWILPTDAVEAQRIAEIYREAGCWTWFDSHEWFSQEAFMPARDLPEPADEDVVGTLMPLNFMKLNFQAPVVEAPPTLQQKLRRKVGNLLGRG